MLHHEIAKLYIDSWKCVQKDGKRFGPMWKDKRRGSTYNSVSGRNYYHAGMFRSMPELSEGSEAFYDWANTKIRASVADDFGADADKLLAKAIECDDVVSNGDPFKATITGADTLAAEQKKTEEADKPKLEIDKKLDKNILSIIKEFQNRESELSLKFRKMPEFMMDQDAFKKGGLYDWAAKQVTHMASNLNHADVGRIIYHAKIAELVKFRPEEGVAFRGWDLYGIDDEEEEQAA